MKLPEFNMALRGGGFEPTKYHKLVYTRMHGIFILALHKSKHGKLWIVSDPNSGAKVCTVTAFYKGMPVASGCLTVAQARLAALADIDSLIDRIGFDRFESVLNNPKPF
jgi:hypothetical protein